MKVLVARDDLVIDPGVFARGAGSDDFREIGVDSNFEIALPSFASQPMRHMKTIERQDRAWLGRKPTDLVILHRHGEYSEPVSIQE